MTTALDIQNVTKRYGTVAALDGFDMRVAAGEIHGFLGPNGAGKTTTLRVLLGMLRIDSGSVRVLGGDPWRDAVRLHARMVYVPGDVALWPQLTGGEAIDVLSSMHGAVDAQRQKKLIAAFELDVRKRCHTYSKGNRQKVALVAALSAQAELLLLDEPTSGLDPLMEVVFRDAVQSAHAHGTTVVLSSHILSEVDALCDHVTIVRAGQRVLTGSIADLRSQVSSQVTATLPPCDIPGVTDAVWHDQTVHCTVNPEQLPALLAFLGTQQVRQLTIAPPSLEDIFLSQYHSAPAVQR